MWRSLTLTGRVIGRFLTLTERVVGRFARRSGVGRGALVDR